MNPLNVAANVSGLRPLRGQQPQEVNREMGTHYTPEELAEAAEKQVLRREWE